MSDTVNAVIHCQTSLRRLKVVGGAEAYADDRAVGLSRFKNLHTDRVLCLGLLYPMPSAVSIAAKASELELKTPSSSRPLSRGSHRLFESV